MALGGARYNTSGILITAGASANGINAVAIGGVSSAREANALALGASANASGVNGVAVGRFASTSGLNVYAMGLLANASADFATAVGASTSFDNQIVLGTNISIYTAPGLGVGGASRGTANQSDDIQFVTTDDQGNLGTTTASPPSSKTSAPSGTTKTAYSETAPSSSAPVASQSP